MISVDKLVGGKVVSWENMDVYSGVYSLLILGVDGKKYRVLPRDFAECDAHGLEFREETGL